MSLYRKKLKNTSSIQDILFLVGIIVFSSILIIGLFPGRLNAGLIDENFFITAMMTVPIIAAIYLIVISFRRSINIRSSDIPESLKKKITLSFVFIAMLSAIPIVIISSNYFNKNLSKMFSGRTMNALNESVNLTHRIYNGIENQIKAELKSVSFVLERYLVNPGSGDIGLIKDSFKSSYSRIIFFSEINGKLQITGIRENESGIDYRKLYDFYKFYPDRGIRTDRVKIDGKDIISGMFRYRDMMIVVYMPVSEEFINTENIFRLAREDYRIIESQKDYFESGTGSFLMLISIIIVGIAYLISIYISGNITRPLLELSSASKQIAMGNNKLFIKKRSDDEIGVLVEAFNTMASQLDENQKVMYQKQKLEAWNEMARKLVHEIKNPLTPIRLSAERMRKLVKEGNPARDDAVVKGSETIIAEVNTLLKLVSEFNNFARLPIKKAELSSLNKLVDESILLFHAYDRVEFRFNRDDRLEDILIDRALVRQALNNIISNSIQAMSDKGLLIIDTFTDSTGRYQSVRIKDNGPGIKTGDIDKIFEPGFTRKKGGTGLGLAIVEKIVFEHEGRISCHSVEHQGAEFTLMFPIRRGDV